MQAQNRILKLPLEERLPTLKVGDVVIGAATQVPPLKPLSLSQEGSHWRLRVQPALPKELIEKGTATFEQEIDWSGDSGEITLVDIPPQPFHIGDILDPKWSGYVQAGDPIQKGLKVTASASLDWKPTYKGSIEFDKNVGEGIVGLNVSQAGILDLGLNILLDGQGKWESGDFINVYDNIFPAQVDIINIDFGLFRTPLYLTSKSALFTTSDIEVDIIAEINYDLTLDFRHQSQYSSIGGKKWEDESNATKIFEKSTLNDQVSNGNFIVGSIFYSDIQLLNEPSLTGVNLVLFAGSTPA